MHVALISYFFEAAAWLTDAPLGVPNHPFHSRHHHRRRCSSLSQLKPFGRIQHHPGYYWYYWSHQTYSFSKEPIFLLPGASRESDEPSFREPIFSPFVRRRRQQRFWCWKSISSRAASQFCDQKKQHCYFVECCVLDMMPTMTKLSNI